MVPPKEFPIELGPELESDHLSLFNLWLRCGRHIDCGIDHFKHAAKSQHTAWANVKVSVHF